MQKSIDFFLTISMRVLYQFRTKKGHLYSFDTSLAVHNYLISIYKVLNINTVKSRFYVIVGHQQTHRKIEK